MAKRGLGTGLDALFGETEPEEGHSGTDRKSVV